MIWRNFPKMIFNVCHLFLVRMFVRKKTVIAWLNPKLYFIGKWFSHKNVFLLSGNTYSLPVEYNLQIFLEGFHAKLILPSYFLTIPFSSTWQLLTPKQNLFWNETSCIPGLLREAENLKLNNLRYITFLDPRIHFFIRYLKAVNKKITYRFYDWNHTQNFSNAIPIDCWEIVIGSSVATFWLR